MAKKHNEKFDPNEVPALLEKAKAGDIVARDELLYRFQRLVATLVNVCITGRPNYWSSYQKTFLQMFAGKNKPIQDTASMLKKNLAGYEKEELFSTGQLAVLLAVDRCETNFASTIVICFKDLIHKMIKDPNNSPNEELDINEPAICFLEAEVAFKIFLEGLSEEEFAVAQRLIEGEKILNIPMSLEQKLADYIRN